MRNKQRLNQVAVRAYSGRSGELVSSVSVTPGSVAVYVPPLYATASDALRARANDCPATLYSTTYATVVGTHDRSSVLLYGSVCFREEEQQRDTSTRTNRRQGKGGKRGR